ncbi:MAG: nucleotidyltransferase domain-containing protein [Bacillota bacterium]|nr:nucleotidyltransferase domain-containing protein [Bacillota bacterium]
MSELNGRLLDLARRYAQSAEAVLGDQLVSVVLFGSVARQQCTPTSDIDLIVVLREAPRAAGPRRAILEPVRASLQPLLDDFWREGVFTDFTELIFAVGEARKTHRLFLEVIEDGVILYDSGGFFAGVLERLGAALRQMGAQRKTVGNLRYWDLKPDFKPGDVVEI